MQMVKIPMPKEYGIVKLCMRIDTQVAQRHIKLDFWGVFR
jgi:hypothetical protein